MAITLFRLGLWIIFMVLGLYVVRETFLENLLTFLNETLLNRMAMVGIGCLALGVVAWFVEKFGPKKKGRCKVCRRDVPSGEFYCRAHLRDVLERGSGADFARRHR